MLSRLRSRLRGADGQADAAALLERIEELTAANRRDRDLHRERKLVRLRHRAGAALVAGQHEAPSDRSERFPSRNGSGLAEANPGQLTGPLVRGAIEGHGYILVRGLLPPDEARRFAARIEAAFGARQARARGEEGEPGLYEEFQPEPPHSPIRTREWIEAGGGLLAADAPSLMFEMFEIFDRVGLRRVISEFLDEPPTISVQKSALRRAAPATAGGWHQDGSFMGDVRALNVWVSLSHCGERSPGLDFVPRRIDRFLEVGGEGAALESQISPLTVAEASGGVEVVRPLYEPGDVMLFDDLFLHRTGSEPDMPEPRYAIESWFFGASGFPPEYVPLAV